MKRAPRGSTTVWTVGHSTRSAEDFVDLLRAHGVELVVDVRTIPRSRHNPQFEQTELARLLGRAGIGYVHSPALGGLRRPQKESANLGWNNASFRGYADHMATEGFAQALDELLAHAARRPTAVMCAEAVPWRCHRSLIADALLARGARVEHLVGAGRATEHTLTSFARVEGGQVTYPAPLESARTRSS